LAARSKRVPALSNRKDVRRVLNLVEGFFSKLGRSALRHIRVASKQAAQGAHHRRR
jgi:hypothetical protein